MTFEIILLLVFILLSAFFSAAEVAFISLSDAKVAAMKKRNTPRAHLIAHLKRNPRRLLITILIGNNVVNIAAASLATVVAASVFESGVIGITTGVMTLLILIFGEIVPKSYATNHPKMFAVFAAPIIQGMSWLGRPVIVLFEWMTRVFAGEAVEQKVSEEELRAMAYAGSKQGTIEADERRMIERLFLFNDITAEDIMTPRVQMVTIPHDVTIDAAAEIIRQNPHTRFPIVKGTPDQVLGFVHSRDVLLAFEQEKEAADIKDILRPALQVPKQMRLDHLMREFQKKQTHMAVVLDEYGGTEGIVTFEDVIEELVGEIADEHDVNEHLIQRINKRTIIAAADEEVRSVNQFFNVAIPGDPLATLAEVLLDNLQTAPRTGMQVSFENVMCTIESVKKGVIEKVKIEKT